MIAEHATEILSRIQFAFTIGFHIIFPTLNIGLGLFLAIMEGMWLKTKMRVYYKICRFWAKIFALTFGMGVVSGVVLHYEIGTNFSGMTKLIGSVLGPLFSYEVLTAFFLESGFLGIMLFGWHKVGRRLHFTATCLVAIGTMVSAFWIMSANSWMQTPSGAILGSDGMYHAQNWLDVIFNPSVIPRFIHMLLASLITTCFVIAGVSAWYLTKNRHLPMAKTTLHFVMMCALVLVPSQIIMGDIVGLNIYQHQPIKTAAMEGNWHTQQGAPLILFGIPDQEKATNHFTISIPKLASYINTHQMDGELIGLDSVPKNERPHVASVFFSFRIMVAVGLLFLTITLSYLTIRLRKKRLINSPLFLKTVIMSAPLGFVATITGWLVAEIGRQPWVVYGLVKVKDIISPIKPSMVSSSLTAFVIVYTLISIAYGYYLTHIIRKGPVSLKDIPPTLGYMDHISSQNTYKHSNNEEKFLP